jgi:hypothetical protein
MGQKIDFSRWEKCPVCEMIVDTHHPFNSNLTGYWTHPGCTLVLLEELGVDMELDF